MYNPFLKTYKIIEYSNFKGEKYFMVNYGNFFDRRYLDVNGIDWFSEENGSRFIDLESAEAAIGRHKQKLSDHNASKFSSKIVKYV